MKLKKLKKGKVIANRCKNREFQKTGEWNWQSSCDMVITKDGPKFIHKGEIVEGQGNIPVYKEYVYECTKCGTEYELGKPVVCSERI